VAVHVAREPVRKRSALQDLALLISIALLAIGVAGFIPGITTHYSELDWAGADSKAMLLDAFQVSVLFNLIYLTAGFAGLVLSWTAAGTRAFLVVGGAFFLGLALYGLLTSEDSAWNFIPLNRADDWLNLTLGLVMFLPAVLPAHGWGWTRDTAAGLLASAAIFVSAVGVAYRPLRLVPLAILLALFAAAIGGRNARLAMIAASVGALCFVLGMAFAVATSHPLW
jgi:hypothetical protein